MRGAWFGFYALSLLGMHFFFLLLEKLGRFPYFPTPLYPLILLFVLLISIVGAWEKDKNKFPSITALVLSAGLMVHWVVMLIQRVNQ